MKYEGIKSTGPRIGDVLGNPPKRKKPTRNPKALRHGAGYHTNVNPTASREIESLLGSITQDPIRDETFGVDGPKFDAPFSESKRKTRRTKRRSSTTTDPEELLPGLDEALQESFVDAFLSSNLGTNSLELTRGVTRDDPIPDVSRLL